MPPTFGVACYGDGDPTLDDCWLPQKLEFKPYTKRPNTISHVYQLFTASGEWDHDVIDANFLPIDGEVIKTIPVGNCLQSDKLIWHFDWDGSFSV